MRLLNTPPSRPIAPVPPRASAIAPLPVPAEPTGGGLAVFQPAGEAEGLEGALLSLVAWGKTFFGGLKAAAPAAPAAPAPSAPAPSAPATVTVGAGDSLSGIAARVLGDANRWREIYDANRDTIVNPNVIYAGQVLRLPGGAVAPAPAPAAPASGFGGRAASQARALVAAGYRYTVNLTTNYHPVRFAIGCCADFAVDAWAKAGIDLYGRINNPHYCPNLVNYFKAGQDGHRWVGPGGGAQVGDMVFFDWDHSGDADHTAIVTEVDGNGRPTKIAESYDFNLPSRERAVGSSVGNIIGYGRA